MKTLEIGAVAAVGSGNSAPQDKELFVEGIHSFIRTSDVGKIHIGLISESKDKLNSKGIQGLRLQPAGTILFPKSGASTFLNHRVLMTEEAFVSSHLSTIKANNKILLDSYLFYYLQTIDARNLCQDQAYPSLNRGQIAGIHIPVPSLPEQKAIVEKLDAAFAGIDELDRVSKSQIVLAENVMASYLDKILNTGDCSAINSLPLGELAEKVVVAFVGSTSQFYAETGVPFLRTQNVTRQGVQVDNLKFVTKEFHEKNIKSQLAAGDVLLSRVITDRVTVGVVPNKIIPSNCANVIIVRPGGRLVPEYLAAYVSSASSQRYLLSRKVGSAQMVVNTGIVKNWPIPVISLEEQKKVSDQIAEMRESVADLQGKLRLESELFDELRSALLHEAFSTESNVA